VIRITLNKRYITLAPIANLIGIAFNLQDPVGLLSSTNGRVGITLALVDSGHPGLEQLTYHNPMMPVSLMAHLRGQLKYPSNQSLVVRQMPGMVG